MLRYFGGIDHFDNACLLVGGKLCGNKGQGDVYTTSGQYLTVYFSKESTLQYAEFVMTITPYHTGKKNHISCRYRVSPVYSDRQLNSDCDLVCFIFQILE